jgi:small-conductance mechanosensitive channel
MAVSDNASNSIISVNEINNAISLINPLIIKIFIAVMILLLGFIISKIIEKLLFKILDIVEFDKLIKRFVRYKHPSKTISIIVSYIINAVSLVMALNKLEITTTIITTIVIVLVTVLVLFVVFGTNDLFANFFAGIIVRIRKNIRVDEFIRIKDSKKKIEGKILTIGNLSIRLETESGEIVYIPNMLLFKSVITKVRKQPENTLNKNNTKKK